MLTRQKHRENHCGGGRECYHCKRLVIVYNSKLLYTSKTHDFPSLPPP